MKLFKCKYCREKKEAHELSSRLPQVCKSIDCIKKKYDEFKEKVHAKAKVNLKREKVRENKSEKEKLKTHKDYLKDLQKVFNEFIRKRDLGKPCVSCGADLKDKTVHASHFFSVGSHPNLRFNEDNVHSSCDYCNVFLHGHLIEYTLRLPERIGQERFDELMRTKNEKLKLTIPEIKELIKHYKLKIKEL